MRAPSANSDDALPVAPYATWKFLATCLEYKSKPQSFIRKGMTTACWEWTGTRKSANGYGVLRFRHPFLGSIEHGAHRIAVALRLKKWFLSGQYALHQCDFCPCVNPFHIYVGTKADNALDASVRDRGIGKARKGIPAANRKYSDSQMQSAIDMYYGPQGNGTVEHISQSGGHTIASLALRFNTTDMIVRSLVTGKTKYPWKISRENARIIHALFHGHHGQGMACLPGRVVAKWTMKTISNILNIPEGSLRPVLEGRDRLYLKRPSWAKIRGPVHIPAKLRRQQRVQAIECIEHNPNSDQES